MTKRNPGAYLGYLLFAAFVAYAAMTLHLIVWAVGLS